MTVGFVQTHLFLGAFVVGVVSGASKVFDVDALVGQIEIRTEDAPSRSVLDSEFGFVGKGSTVMGEGSGYSALSFGF